LIRVAILADTHERAQQFATVLGDDDRFEVIDARAFTRRATETSTDVIVAVRLSPSDVADLAAPVVLVADVASNLGGRLRAILRLTASPGELAAAVEAAAMDLTVLTQDQVLRWVSANHRQLESQRFIEELTPRELEVLHMMSDGNGNKEIAAALAISEHTVKFHVAQILGKLNAGSRTEAVSLGIRRGLIPI
jgi:DNA-binding CsgD family transcriptional regulator